MPQLGHAQIAPRLLGRHPAATRLISQLAEFLLYPCGLRRPMHLHLVVHAQRGGLVDRHHHRLAHEAPPEEVPHDVLRHGFQPVVAGDQVVLPPQHLLQLGLLIGVEFGILDQAVDVVVEVGIDELQFRRAVLVEQRHGGAVFDGLLEVVDRDVVAEDFLGALLTGNQRRAGKGQEHRLGQRGAHVERQRVVLAAVRLVGQHDHVGTVAEQLRRLELVHQREHVAVVAAQQFAQVGAAGGMAFVALGLAHRAGGLERLGDLLVQFHPVGDHHEGPVAGQLAQHLLREEHHRKALAAALRLPEHAAAPVAKLAGLQHRGDGVVDAEELVVLAENLDQPGLVLGEQREVLDQIEQAGAVASAAQHHFQRHAARFVLALDALPLHPASPVGGERADAAVGAVAGDEQRVAPEQCRNLLLVVGQVFVEGRPRRHAGFLEFDHHPGQAIDEADQVGPAGVERAGHAELADQQEVVVRRMFPIHDAQTFGLLPAVFLVGHGHRDAFLEQPIRPRGWPPPGSSPSGRGSVHRRHWQSPPAAASG